MDDINLTKKCVEGMYTPRDHWHFNNSKHADSGDRKGIYMFLAPIAIATVYKNPIITPSMPLALILGKDELERRRE